MRTKPDLTAVLILGSMLSGGFITLAIVGICMCLSPSTEDQPRKEVKLARKAMRLDESDEEPSPETSAAEKKDN